MSRILIAEDNDRISAFIDKGLRANGFTTTVVADGVSAVDYATTGEFDLIIVDLGLPGLDGFEVIGSIRGAGVDVPVIILTARDSVRDTVFGLEGGADDYMTKPFRFEELLARIRLRLRGGTREPAQAVLEYGSLAVDLHTRRATVDGVLVTLTSREFVLLEMFMRHSGQVLSREQLLSHVWGYDYDPGSNIVDVYVGMLRKKIGTDRIKTVRGMGYGLP